MVITMTKDEATNLRFRFVTTECPICHQPCNGSAYVFTKPDGVVRKGVACMSGEEPEGWVRQEKLTKDKVPTGWFNYFYTTDEAEQEFETAIANVGNASRLDSYATTHRGFLPDTNEISIDDREEWNTWARDTELKIQSRYPSLGFTDLINRGLDASVIEDYDFIEFTTTAGIIDVPIEYKKLTSRIFGYHATRNLIHGDRGSKGSPSSGYYIPIYNYCGEITGYQLRYHPWYVNKLKQENPKYKGKYIWAKGYEGDASFSPRINGELPLQTLRSISTDNRERRTLLLAEGVLKPLILYENLGGRYSVMGASGGLFSTSRHQFVASLLAYKLEYGITNVCWCCDPGSFRKGDDGKYKSTNVIAAIKGAKALVESCGLKFKILNWQQWYEKDPSLDPDVVDAQVIVDALPKLKEETTFETAFNSFASRVALNNGMNVDYKTHENAVTSVRVAKANDVLGVYQDAVFDSKRIVINGLSLGAGKTHTLGDYELLPCFDKEWYFSQTPREPATLAIEQDFYPLIGRHGGLVPKKGIKTPSGEQVYKLPTADSDRSEMTEGNCAKYNDHLTALSNGIPGISICRRCPHFQACKAGEHEHYDYLYQRITADYMPKVRANVLAVSPDNIKPSHVVVFDEPIVSAPPYVDFKLTVGQARAYLKHMNRLLPYGLTRLHTTEDSVYLYKQGLEEFEILAVASQIDEEIREEKNSAIANKDRQYPKGLNAKAYEFFAHLLNPDVRFNAVGSSISAVVPNLHVRNIIKNAGQVIFLDATCEPEMLAAQYGLDLDEILYISTNDLATNSVEVEVYQSNHMNARKQTIHQKKAIMEEVRDKLTDKYAEGIGFIAHSEYAKEGEIVLFSNSRGSNLYQYMEAICIFGLPQPNLGVIESQYRLLPGDYKRSFTFNDYYNYMKHSELKQAIGRIRGYQRQGERLKVYIVANAKLGKLESEGYTVNYKVAAFEGIESAATRQTDALQNIWRAAKECVEADMEITSQTIADAINKGRRTVERVLQTAGTNIKKVRALLADDVERNPENGYITLPWEVVNAIKEEIPDSGSEDDADYATLLNNVSNSDIMDCFVILSNNKGKWPKYLKGFQVRTLLIALCYRLRYFMIIGNDCDCLLAWEVANLVLQKSNGI